MNTTKGLRVGELRVERGEGRPCGFLTAGVCCLIVGMVLFAGWLLTGCASSPTGLERKLFTMTTNYVNEVRTLTNVVNEVHQVPQVVLVTNVTVDHQVLITSVTNVVNVDNWRTNYAWVTNRVQVETLGNPTSLASTGASIAGSVSSLGVPGIGGLVTAGITGLLAVYAGIRNRKLTGKNDALNQTAGTLAQIIETAREVLSKTTQGQAASDKLTAWMVSHQAATGTIAAISQIVRDNVNNDNAQAAANQIMGLIGTGAPKG